MIVTKNRLLSAALLAALALPLLPQQRADAEFAPVEGTAWRVVGKTKEKVKGVGKVVAERTVTVTFEDATTVVARFGFFQLFEGNYTGGATGENGKLDKRVVVTLTEQQVTDAEGVLADQAEDILRDKGIDARPEVQLTSYKVGGRLAKNGDVLKVAVKFKFTASALGKTRKGVYVAKLKGPRAPS